MRGEVPVVSEGIFQAAGPVAVKFVFNRSDHLRAGRDGLFHERVYVPHVHHDAYGRAPERLRALAIHLREFIRQHEERLSDLDFRMAHGSIWTCDAHDFYSGPRF